jgi:hypothetical protein
MRYLVCLIGGALFGALMTLTAANILSQRNAWPRALMTVMQHELGQARDKLRDDRCDAPELASSVVRLRLLSTDIEPALLAAGAHDRVFSQYAKDLRDAIAAFEATGTDCAVRRQAVTRVADACEACHRDYK